MSDKQLDAPDQSKNSEMNKPDLYWENAGQKSYAQAMYQSSDVERHVRHRLWRVAVEIGEEIGIPHNGTVLDYGCGDGAFANQVLAQIYPAVHGYDNAKAAIARANAEAAGPHVKFLAADVVSLNYSSIPHYDGVYLIGILHHIKAATPDVLRSLGRVSDRMVILEPNGNHLLRKLLEFTPTYRAAGEDSFRTREIKTVLEDCGWRVTVFRRLNLFPNFTPGPIFRLLHRLEPKIEASPILNAMCTVNMLGVIRA